MAATDLTSSTASTCRLNSPRDLEDASDVSGLSAVGIVMDATAGGTVPNNGNIVLGLASPTGDSDGAVFHILRKTTTDDAYPEGLDLGDDAGHTYDVVTVAAAGLTFVGPLDPHRYGSLITVIDSNSDATGMAFALDISTRRTAVGGSGVSGPASGNVR